MGLIKCLECGKEISDMAQSCPNCGRPLRLRQSTAPVQNMQQGPDIGQGAQPAYNQMQQQPPRKRGHGCLITFLVICITLVLFAIFIVAGTKTVSDGIQREISGVSSDSEYITMDAYNKIDTGMSYEEVKEIVGSAGTVTSQVESNGIKIVIITWYGNGIAGSNANVTFTNNEVTGKAQVGLQ